MGKIFYLSACTCLMMVGCDGFGPGITDFQGELGNGYLLVQFNAHQIEIMPRSGCVNGDEKCLPSKIVSCGVDRKIIVAKQQLLDAKGKPIAGDYKYWIVDGPLRKRYGPFTEKEFLAKRTELGVPDSVKLRSKDSFRP